MVTAVTTPSSDPCNPSPCGPNARCDDGICTCTPEYQGDPYIGCRPECLLNNDCPLNKACSRNKCIDPCQGTCGQNAICNVYNHIPMCSCPIEMTGNAFVSCTIFRGIKIQSLIFGNVIHLHFLSSSIDLIVKNVCNPSPCGPNSQCREINGHAVCSCIIGFFGTPPTCRPECTVNSDCPPNEICSNQKCRNPCKGTCGIGAKCTVTNRNPICFCSDRFTGDPFVQCIPMRKT